MGLGGFILIGAVEVALQCRVYVLYECNKKLLWFNAIFCVLELTGMVTLFLIDVGRYSPLPTPPGMTGCWSENINAEWSLGIWLICLVYESWLSFLVAYKAYHNIKLYGFRSRVLTVIVRDSLLWFLMLAVCLLFMCISWTVFARSQPGLILVGLPLTHASATLGGTRLLLNLRAAYFDSQAMSGLSTTVATSPSAVWAKRSVNNAGVPVGDQDIEIAEIWLKKSSSLGEYDRTYGYGLGGQCSRQATSTSATRHDE
ncbi:hypothetical protein FRC03_003572 [Tulasnella sp. 419]|nr:hypothetical protein FRC02_001399 [Tulasnella sp. 418]KAG8962955.1 hypothetical protein FRC03_003572 [Tulasnella sp. 419]